VVHRFFYEWTMRAVWGFVFLDAMKVLVEGDMTGAEAYQ
jgi:hypothetical protein